MIRSALFSVAVGAALLAAPAAFGQSLGESLGGAAQNYLSRGGSGLGSGSLGGGGLGSGGLGGLLGQFAPSVSSAPTGNVAGLLSYCLQNNDVRDPGTASSTLSALNRQDNVAALPGYAQGQRGLLQTGSGNALSVSSLGQQAKPQLCNMILSRARSLL
ncbi:MAG: DUF2501 domain-containing protein [Gluconacetobacter diazotrophicus]|nr:DUF2501 domain-containing protein [Gluconacetobacter diazotrophicus]